MQIHEEKEVGEMLQLTVFEGVKWPSLLYPKHTDYPFLPTKLRERRFHSGLLSHSYGA